MWYLANVFKKKTTLMHKIIITSVLVAIQFIARAQNEIKPTQQVDLTLSYGPKEFITSLAWSRLHPILKSRKFQVGYGLRYNGYISNDKDYITAPAILTSGERGPQVLFIENIEENIDTFSLHNAQHNSINAVIYLNYQFNPKWSVGFNIDAVGIAFGGSREGMIISSNKPAAQSNLEIAKPTAYNALLISDNDIGMLNSELYTTYNLKNNLSVKAGFTFLFTEYTTNKKITYNENNDRFRHKSLMGMIGIQFNL